MIELTAIQKKQATETKISDKKKEERTKQSLSKEKNGQT